MNSLADLAPERLAATDLFHGLPPAALAQLAAAARLRRIPRQHRIFNQGDEHVRAHILLDGWVRISQSGIDGAQIVLRFIPPDQLFGTMALFTDGQYPADATTLVDAEEASWSEADLMDYMQEYPAIAINAVRIVGRRLQEMQERMREMATLHAEQRIAQALLRLAGKVARHGRDGATIPFPLRRKDIADVAGTTLYTASRILSVWEDEALLSSRHHILTIHRSRDLARIAGEERA